MGTQLRDGTGKGYLAKVDARNDLHTAALTRTISQVKALSGWMFSCPVPVYTTSSAGGRLLAVKVTETAKICVLEGFRMNWNGGSTNFNRTVYVDYYIGDAVPSANMVALGAAGIGCTNTNSPNVMAASVWMWNTVGDGMTMAGGTRISSEIHHPGHTFVDLLGHYVIAPNSMMSLNVRGEEVGKFCVTAYFYLIDPTIDEY
jgi:hypothetical protein